jgi:hypothetical protein
VPINDIKFIFDSDIENSILVKKIEKYKNNLKTFFFQNCFESILPSNYNFFIYKYNIKGPQYIKLCNEDNSNDVFTIINEFLYLGNFHKKFQKIKNDNLLFLILS